MQSIPPVIIIQHPGISSCLGYNMATDDDSDVPATGGVFTFGKSKFADNAPSKFWIRDDKVLHVSCGDEHTALVADSGRIFTFGDNAWGQLGLGHTKIITKPTRIKSLKEEKVKYVACGRSHTLLATESGKVYTFGCNGEGQLGLGVPDDKICTPTNVASLPQQQYKMLSAGMDHSAALTEDGDVYMWGGGSEGQLGLGAETEEAVTPTKLQLDEPAVCIACGYYHTAIVTESGKLLTFGETEDGKLGLGGHSEDHCTPQEVTHIWGKVVWVACGGSHTIAVTEDGKVYSFGNGSQGQLGHGNIILHTNSPQEITWQRKTKVRFAACGENHSAFITDRGQLWTCGDGRHGKLALGDENFANQFKPSLVARFAKFTVEKVSCGGCHMLALAKPRVENGDVSSGESLDEIEESPGNHLTSAVIAKGDLAGSYDLSGSISARNRRRGKLPEASGSLNRTLPPLNSSSLGARSLPPLGASPLAGGDLNPLNHTPLPTLHPERTGIGSTKDEESEETSEEESESEDEDHMQKQRNRMKRESAALANKSAPKPKPRGSAASKSSSQEEYEEGGSGEDKSEVEESENEDKLEDDEPNNKPVPVARRPPKLQAQSAVEVSSSPPHKSEASEEEEQEEHSKKKKKAPKKTKKKLLPSDEEELSEEEEEVKPKKKEKSKLKKKKTGGLFGKKKILDSEEEEEDEKEESEEQDSEDEKPKKKQKSKGKKSKKAPVSEDEDEEKSEEEIKRKSKKKTQEKTNKSKKKAKALSEDEDESKKTKKPSNEAEEEKPENKLEEENKSEEEKEEKDEDEKPEEKKTEEPKKKSRTCTIL